MNRAILVQGLGYGDEAKGATVDFLCRTLPVDLVVRFNGGPQAAHNVVTPEGVHHTFAQFGSGMLANVSVRTHLSRFMLVDPLTMMNEARALNVAVQKTWLENGGLGTFSASPASVWARTTVDPRCVVITPYHKQVNRLREEARGGARHGSCGMGVGVAREWSLSHTADTLYAGDLADFDVTKRKLARLLGRAMKACGREAFEGHSKADLLDLVIDYHKWYELVTMSATLPTSQLAVFEGAQGVLLDETHGEAPYHTWTDCTFANADKLCGETGIATEDRFRIGCLRTYSTRHGAGPLEDEGYPGVSLLTHPEPHNAANKWQGDFRLAPFNERLVKRAVEIVGGVDLLALSHCDYSAHPNPAAYVAAATGLRVGIAAYGPAASDRRCTSFLADVRRSRQNRPWYTDAAQEAPCL